MPDHSDAPGSGLGTRITSLQNDRVKAIRALEMRKARRETGQFVAEGASVLISARDHGWQPEILVLGPEADANPITRPLSAWAQRSKADCLHVSGPVLEKLASKENPQSVMAVFQQRWADVPKPETRTREALWIALEDIRDPGNLGTIIRTADAAGASGIILVGQTCDPYSREAVRASMGSIFAVPIARLDHAEFHALARDWKGEVVGTHLNGNQDFRTVTYAGPCLLVMGNEGAGLTASGAAACRRLVRIPMTGSLDSLNLAVATALMLYEIRRASLKL
jgi:RNA methyltransferase, TrmH family